MAECSDALRKMRSEAAKIRWSDPFFKARVSAKIKQARLLNGYSEETLKKYSEAAKARHRDVNYKRRLSASLKEKWQDPEYRKHMSDIHKGLNSGESHPMFGKHHSEEVRKKIKENWNPPKIHPMLGKTHTEEVRRKLSISHSGVPLSEKHRASIGKASKKVWATVSDEKRDEWTAKMRKGLQCVPNKPESAILSILDSQYPGEWRFVGDGQIIISGKCPDFINVNGKKKIIELFGDYWHRGENPQDRADIFKPYGYETLVIWEHELKHIDEVLKKIHIFAAGGGHGD